MTANQLETDHDTVFGGINLLLKTLHGLDERGLVLALAAFAEDSLGTLIKTFMRNEKASTELVEGFNAPLGTLSARIRAAYALGLVTKGQFEDLEHLRKIRNAFSHTWKSISFDDPVIAGHIRGIHFSMADDEFPETPEGKVRICVAQLLVELHVTTTQIAKRGQRAAVIGSRLVSGKTGTPEEQFELAKQNLEHIEVEFSESTGERRAFLETAHERWISRLTILARQVPPQRADDVRNALTRFGKARFGKGWAE